MPLFSDKDIAHALVFLMLAAFYEAVGFELIQHFA